MIVPGFQLLFALKQALRLSEPCFFSLGVVVFALAIAWVVEDQNCTMNRGLSPLPETMEKKQNVSCSDRILPLGTCLSDSSPSLTPRSNFGIAHASPPIRK